MVQADGSLRQMLSIGWGSSRSWWGKRGWGHGQPPCTQALMYLGVKGEDGFHLRGLEGEVMGVLRHVMVVVF